MKSGAFFYFGTALAVFAQDKLDAVVRDAMEGNRQLVAVEQEWRGLRERVGQQTSWPDPMFGADVERRGTTRVGEWSDVEYMVQQEVPGPGKRSARKQAAVLESEAAGFRYLEQIRATRGKAIESYWNLWRAERSAEVMRRSRDLAAQMEETARTRYESGSGRQGEVLRAQIENTRASNEVVSMEREVGVARVALNAVLDADPETPRSTELEPPLPHFGFDNPSERMRNYCCILIAQQKQVDAREAALLAARREQRPDFQFRVEGRQFESGSGIDEYDTAVFVNVPWLWSGKYRGMEREAEAEVARARAEYDQLQNEAETEIADLKAQVETANRTLNLNRDQLLPQAVQLVESMRSAYQTGQATLLEVLDAQRTQQELELATYRAAADFATTCARLDVIAAPWGPDEIETGLVSESMNHE